MATSRAAFEIEAGAGIGPFRLGMAPDAVDALCREHGLRNEGVSHSGLHIEFHDQRAVRIEIAAALPEIHLSIGGELLTDTSDALVQRLLAAVPSPGSSWREREGLAVFHWELSDDFVFSFMVYSPGYRHLRT
jgi:hypothetical protein